MCWDGRQLSDFGERDLRTEARAPPGDRSTTPLIQILQMLPTFFLVGAAKAGTTSLYGYLSQHPDVCTSHAKEPHYFSWEDDGWPDWAIKDDATYRALFSECQSSQARGEASTWYLLSDGAPERIHAAVPDARIVIVLRDPTQRTYSNWSFNVSHGYETIEDFDEALNAEPKRRTSVTPWHLHYVRASLYHDQVKRYLDRFGTNQVLVLLFEDLKANPLSVIRKVYDFIGVDPSFEPDFGTVQNQTFFPKSRRLYDFLWKPSPLKSFLKSLLPHTVHARLGRELKVRNRKARPALSPEARLRLNERYADDVKALGQLIDRDLSDIWL